MGSGAGVFVDVVLGTGASITVSKLGFRPRWVRLLKPVSTLATLEWTDCMADGAGFKQVGGTQSAITTGGITPSDDGFVIGTDSGINVDGHAIHIIAGR